MKFIYLFSTLVLFSTCIPSSLLAQTCNAANAAAFVTCANDPATTTIDMNANGGGNEYNVSADLDLSGITIDINNDDLILTGNITIDATTSFIGSGNATFTIGGTTFSGNNGSDPNLGDLNQAIIDCGCSTLAEAVSFALPVSLIAYDGKLETNTVLLSWITAEESDNEYFLLEYSTDGRAFSEVGTVAGRGDSNVQQSYEFRHRPGRAATHYYRLRQYDFDGTVAELGIVAVRSQTTSGGIQLAPNPIRTATSFAVAGSFDLETTTFRLVSTDGRQWALTPADNATLELPTGLVPGLYYVQIYTVDGKHTLPLSVVR